MCLLSIIVPVYNTENYLIRCFDSLFNQDIPLNDYEVIIINDGSRDNSSDIINVYQKKYDNIIFINQENKGSGIVRNVGIKQAKGSYIMFVDSDDWIEHNCLKFLLKSMIDENLDLLHCDKICIAENSPKNNIKEEYKINSTEIYNGPEFLKSHFDKIAPEPCITIFKKSLLKNNNLYYRESVFYEDIAFNYKAIMLSNKVKKIDYPFYYYYLRFGTNSRNKLTLKHYKDKIMGYIEAAYFFQENTSSDIELRKTIINWLYLVVKSWLHSCLSLSKNDQIYLFGILKQNSAALNYIMDGRTFKERISVGILKSPFLAFYIFHIFYIYNNTKNV